MTEIVVSIVDWTEKQGVLKAIRQAVFIDEQHVPKHLEWDGHDKECTQFLASIDAQAVATARLTPAGQIGRMAVLEPHRGQGVGSRLLAAVIDRARKQGHHQIFLHAQVKVIGFYQRHGFTVEGDTFMDAGIEHRTMTMDLNED
ncbi:MAG: GNAT family N-acetyltransferase [Gammaproteobacteria bacterium]|nr:GNAT family N-acetyltransferase [Gammaproteobacteria bacterium]